MQQAAIGSGKSEMTASGAESWARLRLVQGESSASKWELVSSLGHTTLTVGSNEDCAWVVREEGVRPIHFSLHWDGGTLRVADVYSAGDVRVDGTLLTSQWRPLLGRVRIEFGKAAIVVETSAGSQPRSSEHPLEPKVTVSEGQPSSSSSNPPATTAARSSAPRNVKETLIGVAPLPQEMMALLQAQMGAPSEPAAPTVPATPAAKEPTKPDSSRAGSGQSERAPSMKATLVGGIGVIPPGAIPGQVDVVSGSGPKPNATLMGFNVANVVDALRGTVGTEPYKASGQVGGAALGDPDQRTAAHGFPSNPPPAVSDRSASGAPASRRPSPTREGMASEAPGAVHGGVAQVPLRHISSAPASGGERIGSAWQERADAAAFGRTLRGMHQSDESDDASYGASDWDGGDRMSDIPTQMRDPATFEARRPNREFPWRYLGVLVLTAVAYFAWLYLLDHI